jgi:uncharacterized protein
MIIDCHAHVYTPTIIANVLSIEGLATFLHLDTKSVATRTEKSALKREASAAGVDSCLLLPVAPAAGVTATNDLFLKMVEGESELFTAGVIHPAAQEMDKELERLSERGVRALKLSSFSQKIDLESEENIRLFQKIRDHNISGKPQFFAILDTFYQADLFFRAPRKFITTPDKLGKLAAQFPEINFVGAHMGGLAAPFREIVENLAPRDNLYLDTSNAAHMFSREEFIRLMTIHGPDRILFGTDWPWFGHAEEVEFIRGLVKDAGFSAGEQSKIFSGNISRLLGLPR